MSNSEFDYQRSTIQSLLTSAAQASLTTTRPVVTSSPAAEAAAAAAAHNANEWADDNAPMDSNVLVDRISYKINDNDTMTSHDADVSNDEVDTIAYRIHAPADTTLTQLDDPETLTYNAYNHVMHNNTDVFSANASSSLTTSLTSSTPAQHYDSELQTATMNYNNADAFSDALYNQSNHSLDIGDLISSTTGSLYRNISTISDSVAEHILNTPDLLRTASGGASILQNGTSSGAGGSTAVSDVSSGAISDAISYSIHQSLQHATAYDVSGVNLTLYLADSNVTGSNSTNGTVDMAGSFISLNYNLPVMIIISVLLFTLVILTAVGNFLVGLALFRFKNLRTVSNYMIGNLALSDFLLAITILPLSACNEALGHWIFGEGMCYFWLCIDVLYCTASIWNLCMIAFDRFTATLYPLWYREKRSPKQAAIYICLVWSVAIGICIPPLLGWNDITQTYKHDPTLDVYRCELFDNATYVVYSASGSFYIPFVITTFLYVRIFIVLRRRVRTMRAARQRQTKAAAGRPLLDKTPTTTKTSATSAAVSATTNLLSVKTNDMELQSTSVVVASQNTDESSRSSEHSSSDDSKPTGDDDHNHGDNDDRHTTTCHTNNAVLSVNGNKPTVQTAASSTSQQRALTVISAQDKSHQTMTSPNNASQHVTAIPTGDIAVPSTHDVTTSAAAAAADVTETAAENNNTTCKSNSAHALVISTSPNPQHNHHNTETTNDNKETHNEAVLSPTVGAVVTFENCNGVTANNTESKTSKQKNVTIAPTANGAKPARNGGGDIVTSSADKQQAKSSHSNNKRQNNNISLFKLKNIIHSPKTKRRASQRQRRQDRETKATIRMAIIIAFFCGFWIGFFTTYLMRGIVGNRFHIPRQLDAIFFWLGYCNSAINPILYTIFNEDFRKAFQKILGCYNTGQRRPGGYSRAKN